MKTIVHILYSFTKTKKGGNPAGVVLDADDLNEKNKAFFSAIKNKGGTLQSE